MAVLTGQSTEVKAPGWGLRDLGFLFPAFLQASRVLNDSLSPWCQMSLSCCSFFSLSILQLLAALLIHQQEQPEGAVFSPARCAHVLPAVPISYPAGILRVRC